MDPTGPRGIRYHDDQRGSDREPVRAIRTVDDLSSDGDLTDRTIFVPDGRV